MNSVYNHILLQNLKNLPRTGQTEADDAFKSNFSGFVNEKELTKQLAIFESFQRTVESYMKTLMTLEARSLQIQKSFGLTTEIAKQQVIAFDRVGLTLQINNKLAKQYASEQTKFLPGQIKNINANTKYNTELQLTNDFLRTRLGLDAKQAFSIRKLANLQGKSVAEVIKNAEDINKELIEETGYTGGLVDILSEIANLNSDIAIQYGRGIPGSLDKSVISAKKFGITLNDLYKTGEKMLDVENATNSAVEYQIFTGKRLEGQKYKNIAASYNQATIEGDSEKQMDIILDLVTAQGETLKTNFKAREAVSKMTGIEASKLIDIIALQEEYNKIGVDSDAINNETKTTTGVSEGVEGILKGTTQTVKEYIEDLTKARTTETTLDRFDTEQEREKTRLAQATADKGKTITSDQLVEGGADMMKMLGAAMETEGGSFILKGATVYADLKFAEKSIADLVKAITDKGTTYDTEATKTTGADGKVVEDAFVRVNDTILFDPNDKINIMASTSQGSLDKTTANMAGGSSNNTSNIGQQVANAISGMSFVVNNTFNGEEIITAMEIIQGNKMNA
jgi:hypothetical protein